VPETPWVEWLDVMDLLTGGVEQILKPWDGTRVIASGEYGADLSHDGRSVVFQSHNLVPGVSGTHIYHSDLETGALTLVSATSEGVPANGLSGSFSLSSDGRYVAFVSTASNLVPGISSRRVYVKDVDVGTVLLVPLPAGYVVARRPSLATGGERVSFDAWPESTAFGRQEVYVSDLSSGATWLVSVTGGAVSFSSSGSSQISANGGVVTFVGLARDVEHGLQVYLTDLETLSVRLVSATPTGTAGLGRSWSPSPSGDGSRVAFWSDAINLVPAHHGARIVLADLETGQLDVVGDVEGAAQLRSDPWYGYRSSRPSLSADGRCVAFNSDASNLDQRGPTECWDPYYCESWPHVYLWDATDGTVQVVDRWPDGTLAHYAAAPSVSADCRYVAFGCGIDGGGHVCVRDLETGALVVASTNAVGVPADGLSWSPRLSADGRRVAFESDATNLVPGTSDHRSRVYVKDLQTGEVVLVSPLVGQAHWPSLSADGRYVAFELDCWFTSCSEVPGVYVAELETGALTLASASPEGVAANDYAYGPSLSGDGRFVAFVSGATNLLPGAPSRVGQVYVKDLVTGELTRVSLAPDGSAGNEWSAYPSLSTDASTIAFYSWATNLVAGTTSSASRAYVADLGTGEVRLGSVTWDDQAARGPYPDGDLALSADGRYLVFESEDAVVPGVLGRQLYIRDLRPE
jgi:Tol biopolymer transport system component